MHIYNFNTYCQNTFQEIIPMYTQTNTYLEEKVSVSPYPHKYIKCTYTF